MSGRLQRFSQPVIYAKFSKMKKFLPLLLLIPSLSWAVTLGESFEILLNTELETLFRWFLKGLLGIILIGAIYWVGAWLMDKWHD